MNSILKYKIRLQKFIFYFKTIVIRPKIYRQYEEKEKFIAGASFKEINRFNLEQRKRLLRHAYHNSSYYKGILDNCNFDIEKFNSDEDYRKIPITTREHIRQNFDLIKAKNSYFTNSYKISTSGTTGKPLTLLHDKRFFMAPLQWRLLKWWGLKPYRNKAFVYRYPRGLVKRIVNTILWWPTSRVFLAGTEMNEATMLKFATKINKLKPNLLQGYIDVVYEFALFLLDNKIELNAPKAVWVTAGPLFKYQRELMEKVFKAPVYDQYGSTEVMMISAECKEQNGLHIMTDTVFVEILDSKNQPVPKGNWGKIVLTDLTNFTFPIIRYEIGDYGSLLNFECKCGVKLPLMDSVMVRQAFKITSSLGNDLNVEFLSTVFNEYPQVVRFFQFEQKEKDVIYLYYQPSNETNIDNILKDIVSKIERASSPEFKIVPKRISKVLKVNGKVPFVISNSVRIDKKYE